MSESLPYTSLHAATRGDHDGRQAFLAALCAATLELAAHYGITVVDMSVSKHQDDLRGHQVAGLIGFAGVGFGGTLALRGRSDLVRACMPLEGPSDNDVDAIGDWIAELANQLLGRTKNKLLRRGVTFRITPPTYAVAHELLVLGCECGPTGWLDLTTTAGRLIVTLELRVDPDFTFAFADCDHEKSPAEGELALF